MENTNKEIKIAPSININVHLIKFSVYEKYGNQLDYDYLWFIVINLQEKVITKKRKGIKTKINCLSNNKINNFFAGLIT